MPVQPKPQHNLARSINVFLLLRAVRNCIRPECVDLQYIAVAEQCCAHAHISETMHAIVMIFIPSCAEIQDEEIESSRIILRCPCPLPRRKIYSVPYSASCVTLCIVDKDHAHFCSGLQRRLRKMANFRRSPLHAGRYLGRYKCDHDNFCTTVLRNSRRKDRYVSRVWAMHVTCTASSKPKCVVIAKNRFPAISVLNCEKFDFGALAPPFITKIP